MKQIQKKKNQTKITDKKLEGEKIYYLFVKNRTKKWVDFEHINDELQLVMQYEKAQENTKKHLRSFKETSQLANQKQSGKSPEHHQYHKSSESKIQQIRKSIQNQSSKINLVSNIVFLNQAQGQFYFKVYYEGGHAQVVSNKFLRAKHPQQLISFYENNVKIMAAEESIR